ncbi:type II secretion system protein GspL [uncultured Roseobacter sp.]|uniref:type II secretion system protein GspL n=1 Tax=uncultured Roseobacter sp. TaxID=114847 RepID=UPI00261FA59A|nr:type II secretion system protein GspL [uncultured Roseobacter sp.]
MFTQYDGGCAQPTEEGGKSGAHALVTCPQPAFAPPICRPLARRLIEAARAASLPDPIILPTAKVTLFSVPLPLKTHRQRVKALAYALEGQLSDNAHAPTPALGPRLGPDHYLVAVCDDATLAAALEEDDRPGIAVPDVLGMPRPRSDTPAWYLWQDAGAIYVRASDGTGFLCRSAELPAFWALAGKPTLTSLNGPVAGGLPIYDIAGPVPPFDVEDLQLDLRHGAFRHRKRMPRRFVQCALAAALVAAGGHMSLLAADVRALSRIADDHMARASAELTARLPDLTADQPLQLIEARVASASTPVQQDPFMTLLSHVSQALQAEAPQITFRELRYGARDGVMTLLIQGNDFGPLQRAEAALANAGLRVTSGTANTTEAGAEVLLQVRSGP